MIIKAAIFTLALITVSASDEPKREPKRHRFQDPLAALDQHLTHSLAYHYLWPWSDLIKAATALDVEKTLEEPKIFTDRRNYIIHLNTRSFKPEELKVKVKNRYVTVEGKHITTNGDNKKFVTNHFVQQFVLPPGSKPEEVTAVFDERGVLILSAPKHELPPPPPEREVPIEVRLPETPTVSEISEKPTDSTFELTTKKIEEPESDIKGETNQKPGTTILAVPQTTAASVEKITETPIKKLTESPIEKLTEQPELSTTHINKIKKKELKNSSHQSHENEVLKLDNNNGLDYALIDTE